MASSIISLPLFILYVLLKLLLYPDPKFLHGFTPIFLVDELKIKVTFDKQKTAAKAHGPAAAPPERHANARKANAGETIPAPESPRIQHDSWIHSNTLVVHVAPLQISVLAALVLIFLHENDERSILRSRCV